MKGAIRRPRFKERWKSVTKCCIKSIDEAMVFLVPQKLIGRWNEVFKTLKVLQDTCGDLRQLKVFTSWTPRIFWNSSKDKNYAFSVFCSFLVSFNKKVVMYTERNGKKKKNHMPCGNSRWLHYFGGTWISFSCQQSSWAPQLPRVMAKEV